MKILRNRKTAIAIAICVIVLATLFGVHRSLDRLARDIENTFYSEGYGQTNIYAQLKKRAEAVMGIVTITKNYPELEKQTEELRASRLELLDAGSISEKGYADLKMSFALDAMFTLGGSVRKEHLMNQDVEITDRDWTALCQYLDTIVGASSVIDRGKTLYNAEAEGFINGQSYSPIARVLRPFAFVEPPELFINAQM